MSLNFLKFEKMPVPAWWKKYYKTIEQAKKDFIASGRIGGNPLGLSHDFPRDQLDKKELKK